MPDAAVSRRTFVAGATASLFPLTSAAARQRRNPVARGGTFPSAVAAGAPRTDGALLWTRCDGVGKAKLRFEVAEDPEFRRVVRHGLAQATPLRDQTARLAVKGLEPGRPYWYRFATRGASSPVGRFRTLRPADSHEPVRIGWFSCQRYEHGWFTPHAGLAAEEDLDLVLSLGDYIYEEDSTPKVPERRDPSGRPNGHVETLEQFRQRHRTYRGDPNLQAMHAAHAVVPIWDDCEVEGDWAGEQESAAGNPSGPRSIPFADKRRNAFLAYFESMPVERSRGPEQFKVFRSLRLGRTAELLLLDTRQYRDPQPCRDGSLDSGTLYCPDTEKPRKRLGAEQQAWLRRSLRESPATWKVLGNAQMMMALEFPPGSPVAVDSWDGYAAERRQVLEAAKADGVRNLVSIVGDVHVFFAGQLTTTGRVGGTPVGTEFVGASISHDALSLPGLPRDLSDPVLEQLPLVNPHLRYARFRNRGYATLEARPDELRVVFKGVRTTLTPTSPSFELARFRVPEGATDLERG
ncbi:alkaline phosphatase [Conexibacter sp. SYSU D00693]|uniref:alkaline phosphatase D family protein n=1 Tax=Conexibacter sp. SYSU D00693 TaxID=2812560 RepID=UPI00196B8563|nr:alkaline phosphatase D family protein [Conexibacter sp. SYSU D00693]